MCDEIEEIISGLNDYKKNVNEKIRMMGETITRLEKELSLKKDEDVIPQLQSLCESIPTPSPGHAEIEKMTMCGISEYIKRLELLLAGTKTALSSIIAEEIKKRASDSGCADASSQVESSQVESSTSQITSLTFGQAFKKRSVDLGIDYAFFEKLFELGGVAVGDIVTQVLLGETWFSGSVVCDYIQIVSANFEKNDAILNFIKRWGTEYCRNVFDHTSFDHYVFRMNSRVRFQVFLVKEDAKDVRASNAVSLDFLKNVYDGKTVTVLKSGSLGDRRHVTDSANAVNLGIYAEFGFKSTTGIPDMRYNAGFLFNDDRTPEDIIKCIQQGECCNFTGLDEHELNVVKPSGASSTIWHSLYRVLDHYKIKDLVMDMVFSKKIASLTGSVVAQALYGELWTDAKTITIIEKWPGSASSYLTHNGYIMHSKTHAHNEFTKVGESTAIRIAKHDAPPQFCDMVFNASQPQLVIRDFEFFKSRTYKVECISDIHPDIIQKYAPRGFKFECTSVKQPKVFRTISPSTLISEVIQ